MTREIPGYRLDVPLPPGRLGPVQAAIRLTDRRPVAVHLVDVRLDGTSRRRFRARTDELGAIAPDPRVVPLLDAGVIDGRPYLVTPRAERSVADLLRAHGPLPVAVVVEAARAGAAALAAYERAGVRHGNVTPANLLMRGDGGIGLTGARIDVLDELAGAQIGPHRPPEELRGEIVSVGTAGDIYALGSTLWTLLAGSPPFGDGTDVALRLRGAAPPALLRSDVTEPLLALVRSMLSADPARRPPGIAVLVGAFGSLHMNAAAGAEPLGDVLATVPPAEATGRSPFDPPSGELSIGPGIQLLGNYEVIRSKPLGSGVSGAVYRGVDRTRRDPVAVKILHDRLRDGPDETRFRREARALAETIGHPNLVRIRDLVVQDKQLAIVMDLVEGGDLAKLIERGPLTPGRACEILRHVAAGLRYLHQARIIHRDIKPRNVLVEPGEFGLAKLSDLSVARSLDDDTITGGGLIGTRPYAAPEVVRGSPASFASDIYSFGIMAYELFVGHRPFRSDAGAARRPATRGFGPPAAPEEHHRAASGPPGDELARPPGLSDQAWHLLSVCLAEEPGRRPDATRLLQMVKALPEATGAGRRLYGEELAVDFDAYGDTGGEGPTHDPFEESTLDDDRPDGGRKESSNRKGGRPEIRKADAAGAGAAARAHPGTRPAWVRAAKVPAFLLVFALAFLLVFVLAFLLVGSVLPGPGDGTAADQPPPDGPAPDQPTPSQSASAPAAAAPPRYVELAIEATSPAPGKIIVSWPRASSWVEPGADMTLELNGSESRMTVPPSGIIEKNFSGAPGRYCISVAVFARVAADSAPDREPVCLAANGAGTVQTNSPG